MTQAVEHPLEKVDQPDQRFSELWQSPGGWGGWIATVNNRPMGKRYMLTTLVFFSAGLVLAAVIRTQLIVPDSNLLGPNAYNGIFTMHGSTMLYLFAVPFLEGLGIYLVPLMIGSRDMAFPRLTNFGYWMYLFGGLMMYASILFASAPNAGWTAYTPLSGPEHSGAGMDFWLLGLSMVEIAGLTAAIEIVVSILKLRAPGMSLPRMPLLVWTYLVAALMIIFAFTPLLLATLMLEMDRSIGTRFFDPNAGGSSLLWQHLFWFFGHPEVYIIFLPATGIVSTIIPVFARRRIVAYSLIVAAILITGFVSFGLWTHHMFTTGLPELPMLFFSAASFMIALAAGLQIFAWVATLWASRPRYGVPLLFVFGLFVVFVNGGLTGVMVATMPFDWQVHETYFVVAHFHHVLIGGAVFPFVAGLHYWLPKLTGRMPNENWGRIAFGLIFIGFNVAFLPMYLIGLYGMPRRIYTYPEELGLGTLNAVSSIGAFTLVAGFFLALLNFAWSARRGSAASADPWNGGTLEWSISSPPPPYGFRRPPVVTDLYPAWSSSASQRPAGSNQLELVSAALDSRPTGWRATLLTDVANAHPQALQHLPGPTVLPFVLAVAILLSAIAVLAKSFIGGAVGLVLVFVLIGWWLKQEPVLPPDEARALSDRLKLPLLSCGRGSVGFWGMLGLIAILATVLASLVFSYFYLRLYSEQWPQSGLPLPSLTGLLLVCVLLLASGILHIGASRAWRREDRRRHVALAASAAGAGLTFVIVGVILLARSPFAPGLNAYASIFFALNGFALLWALTGVGMLAGVLLRLQREESLNPPRLQLWLQNSEAFWFSALAAGLVAFCTTYLAPCLL